MAHKYLDDIGYNLWFKTDDDKRQPQWQEIQSIYGFDERETWSLDATMIALLYERVKMYKEISENKVDLDFHSINIEYNNESKTMSQLEWIDMLLTLTETYLTDHNDTSQDKTKEIWIIWSELSPYMWW